MEVCISDVGETEVFLSVQCVLVYYHGKEISYAGSSISYSAFRQARDVTPKDIE